MKTSVRRHLKFVDFRQLVPYIAVSFPSKRTPGLNKHRFSDVGPELRQRYCSPEAILEVLYAVQRSLLTLLESAKLDPTKGRETARALGLDRTLIWRVTRVMKTEDILAAIGDIPTGSQVERICKACQDRGAPDDQVAGAREAVARFESVVEECAGNREYFEAMVSGLVVDDVTQRQENARKLTFLGNFALWGAEAAVNFKTAVYFPSATHPDIIDAVRIGGLVDFKRSSAGRWPIYRVHGYTEAGESVSLPSEPVLADDSSSPGLPLLSPFCSDQLPEIVPVRRAYGTRFDLEAGRFGNAGALTCVFADVIRGLIGAFRDPANHHYYLASMNDLFTPSEYLVHDIILHRDLVLSGAPEVMLLNRLTVSRGYNPDEDDKNRMPLSAKILNIAPGPMSSVKRYPDYTRMLEFVLERLGLEAGDFVGHRFTMTYPPVPTAVVMRIGLPDRPVPGTA
jgi:hypothetical protein